MNRYGTMDAEAVDLSEFDEAYAKAPMPNQDPQAGEVPDGFYDTVVDEVTIGRTPRSGNPMVSWRLVIQGPTHAGRRLTKHRVVTEKTLSFLKDDLTRFGLEIGRLSELTGHLDEMRSREMRVVKKTKDGWSDIYFLRQQRSAEELDDHLPF
jgi:hypothetical protein